jgi:leader peptidase (prepilin peptidase)/N-methyltransferase
LGVTAQGFKFCLYAALLVGLIFTDIEERILPDEFTLGGAVLGLILAWFVPLQPDLIALLLGLSGNSPDPRVASLIEAVVGAIVPSVTIWLVGVLYQVIRKREGLGFGDVKMLAFMGSFLGLRLSLLVFFVGSILGAVSGLAYILITRKDMSTYELPLGTFLGIAGLLCVMYTEGVFEWYGKLVG